MEARGTFVHTQTHSFANTCRSSATALSGQIGLRLILWNLFFTGPFSITKENTTKQPITSTATCQHVIPSDTVLVLKLSLCNTPPESWKSIKTLSKNTSGPRSFWTQNKSRTVTKTSPGWRGWPRQSARICSGLATSQQMYRISYVAWHHSPDLTMLWSFWGDSEISRILPALEVFHRALDQQLSPGIGQVSKHVRATFDHLQNSHSVQK